MDRAAGPDPRTRTSQLSSVLPFGVVPKAAVLSKRAVTCWLLILDAGKVKALACHERKANVVTWYFILWIVDCED